MKISALRPQSMLEGSILLIAKLVLAYSDSTHDRYSCLSEGLSTRSSKHDGRSNFAIIATPGVGLSYQNCTSLFC